MSAIEWTDETWNPLGGCSIASEGCHNCYAALMAARLGLMGQERYAGLSIRRKGAPAEFTGEVRLWPERLDEPLAWKTPRRVFVNSMSDLFHPEVPTSYVRQVWDVMARCPQHTFQVLTKRPQRLPHVFLNLDGQTAPIPALANVWLGTSIELDKYAFRANGLRQTPAAIRFVSAEPLLGPLPSLDLTDIDWLIIGGESGPGARRMEAPWVLDLIHAANDSGTAVFVKQLGSSLARAARVPGKGGDPAVWPARLQSLAVREYPT